MSDQVLTFENSLESLKNTYETLNEESLSVLLDLYANNARFKDPFQEVYGREKISHVFLKMFEQLSDPHFVIKNIISKQPSAVFLWEFHFKLKRWNKDPISFSGVSWLEFNSANLVVSHQDFWDPSEGIYEHLPIIGPLMRGLKKLA
jgi:steroid delta-isomerase